MQLWKHHVMGWKNVKEHYRIGHNVQVTPAGICIGSGYVHDLIVVALDGTLAKRYESRSNEDLWRYQREMDADPSTLLKLINEPDIFRASIAVYTYDGGAVVEKKCEALGWPNTTHDGLMMYENMFSADRNLVAKWAARNALAGIRLRQMQIERMEQELSEYRHAVALDRENLATLQHNYPEAVAGVVEAESAQA